MGHPVNPAEENTDLAVGLFDGRTESAVTFPALAPVRQHLPRRGAVSDPAQFPRLAGGHVVEDILHGLAVGKGALQEDR